MNHEQVRQLALNTYFHSQEHFYHPQYMIYQETNENLLELFRYYNVKDKEVLSVLASSDQVLSCYYCGAKSIDTFDKVYLTLFYYYLRKWVILYQKQFYPSHSFFESGDKNLYDLICQVRPTNIDEENAIIFWKYYLELNQFKADKYLFYLSIIKQPKPFGDSIDRIKGIFDKEISFTCMDFFKDTTIQKKYDVLLLSNILEYASTQKQLYFARRNIESLLKDDGIAICTYLRNRGTSYAHKKEVHILTSHSLKLDRDNCTYYEPLWNDRIKLAYSYQLKKK